MTAQIPPTTAAPATTAPNAGAPRDESTMAASAHATTSPDRTQSPVLRSVWARLDAASTIAANPPRIAATRDGLDVGRVVSSTSAAPRMVFGMVVMGRLRPDVVGWVEAGGGVVITPSSGRAPLAPVPPPVGTSRPRGARRGR